MDKLYVTIYLYIYQHMFFLSSFSSFLFFCLFHFIQTFLGDIQARWKSRAALFIHSNNKPVGPNILVSHLQPSAEYFIHKLQSKLELRFNFIFKINSKLNLNEFFIHEFTSR